MEYLSESACMLIYELPLGEIVLDFYDQLKSRTRGYASFDYDFAGFRPGELVRVDVLVGGEPVDALSLDRPPRRRVRRAGARSSSGCARRSRARCSTSPIQAAIGSRVIARETVKAKRKDVLAKCYGGDITRKRKLLEKQKEGKKRMKQVGGGRGAAGGVPRGAQPGRHEAMSGASGTSTSTCRSARTAAATATS